MLASLLLGSAVAAATPVKVGLMVMLSGPLASSGDSARLGAQLALQDAQADLAKLGLDVSMQVIDEQNATLAAAAARGFVAEPSVLGVVGPTLSGSALLTSDVLRPANLVMVNGAATAAELTDRGYPNVNRVVARSDAQGSAMADYLAENTSVKKVLVLSDSTTYGNSLADDFEAAASRDHLTTVRLNTVKHAGFDDVLSTVKSEQSDLIYFSGQTADALALLGELRAAKLSVPLAGGSTFESPDFFRTGQGLVRGVLYTSTFGPMNKFSSSYVFAERYKSAFNQNANIFSMFGYDAMRVLLTGLADAARKAGGVPSRAAVSAAVRRVNLRDGLTGPIALNSRGDRLRAPLFVMRVNENTVLPEPVQVRVVRPKK